MNTETSELPPDKSSGILYPSIHVLKTAIEGLEGIPIPYNIIKHHIEPLREWCIQMLEEDGVKNEEKEV